MSEESAVPAAAAAAAADLPASAHAEPMSDQTAVPSAQHMPSELVEWCKAQTTDLPEVEAALRDEIRGPTSGISRLTQNFICVNAAEEGRLDMLAWLWEHLPASINGKVGPAVQQHSDGAASCLLEHVQMLAFVGAYHLTKDCWESVRVCPGESQRWRF